MKYRHAPFMRRKNRLEFDPNSKEAPQWATYVPRRNLAWKVHSKKGVAAGAISSCVTTSGSGSSGILYQYINGKWVEMGRMEPPEFCAWCGEEPSGSYRQLDLPGKYGFEKPHVCGRCYTKHFGPTATEPIDKKFVTVPK